MGKVSPEGQIDQLHWTHRASQSCVVWSLFHMTCLPALTLLLYDQRATATLPFLIYLNSNNLSSFYPLVPNHEQLQSNTRQVVLWVIVLHANH